MIVNIFKSLNQLEPRLEQQSHFPLNCRQCSTTGGACVVSCRRLQQQFHACNVLIFAFFDSAQPDLADVISFSPHRELAQIAQLDATPNSLQARNAVNMAEEDAVRVCYRNSAPIWTKSVCLLCCWSALFFCWCDLCWGKASR